MTAQTWQLHLALGACRAGRLLAAASLACALFALVMLVGHTTSGPVARALWTLAVLAVLPALYLGTRLELDRGLFRRLADAGDAGGELADLDRAMAELGLAAKVGTERPLAHRAGGVFRLAQRLGALVAMQVLVLLAAAWMG